MTDQPKYIIGVDAGGTKTQAVLTDQNENVFAWGKGGPANPTRISPERMCISLKEAITEAMRGSVLPDGSKLPIDAICLGIAGGGKQEAQTLIMETVAGLGITSKIIVVSDVVTAFWSAIPDGCGIIAIAGTGSSAYGVNAQGNAVIGGGWGYLVGDEGSGFDIGRSGMAAVLKAYEGRGPATILQEHLLSYLNLATIEEVRYAIYRPLEDDRKIAIAKFAPLVTEAAEEGDAVAQNILRHAGNEIGLNIVSVAQRLGLHDQAFESGLIGSVFKAGDLIINPLRDVVLSVAPNAKIFVSDTPPSLGAARLAIQMLQKQSYPPTAESGAPPSIVL
ncbi:MAG: hypothetical protein KDD92_02315 [Caldilineaceae bacterium]|nr:hypothetical protein [Caldilineaceae bacterium]